MLGCLSHGWGKEAHRGTGDLLSPIAEKPTALESVSLAIGPLQCSSAGPAHCPTVTLS